jgi:hypothetical protein
MNVEDALTSDCVSREVKHMLLDIVLDNPGFGFWSSILTPTAANDDVNGSQHASNGGNNFTYEDASYDQLSDSYGLTFGTYDYFAREGSLYTGHSYHGEGNRFEAIVVNPPTYAVSYTL